MAGRIKRLVLFVLLAATACAPRLAPPGPGPAAPRLDMTAGDFQTRDGTLLPLRAWLPKADATPKAVIVALHGFNDYSNAFEAPGTYLASHGIATFAYDQRGFGAAPHRGLWPGTDALTGDLVDAARTMRARYPGVPLYLLGDSMGGAVVVAAMTGSEAPPADGIILVAPAVWARSAMPLTHRVALWIGAHTVPWMDVSGRGLGIQASDNIEMLRALGRDPLVIKETRVDAVHGLVDLMDRALAAAPRLRVPALLLYGEKDEVIPAAPILRFWRDLPAAERPHQRRALYADGWHMLLRDLEARVVLDDIVQWIADPRAPLPSGAEAHALARLKAEVE
jgi:alpha-beta hydrolase superfamily lysophospholipase